MTTNRNTGFREAVRALGTKSTSSHNRSALGWTALGVRYLLETNPEGFTTMRLYGEYAKRSGEAYKREPNYFVNLIRQNQVRLGIRLDGNGMWVKR